MLFYSGKFHPKATELVVFFHGLGCSSDSFKNVFDYDYFDDKTVLLIDHVGFGNSAKPEDFSYTMEAQAQLVDELLAMQPLKKIHIVAHSMGTAIALLLKPENISRVVSFSNVEGNLIADDCSILSRGIAEKTFEDYKDKTFKLHLFAFRKHPQLQYDKSNPTAVYKSAVSLVEESDSGKLMEKFKNLDCPKSYFYGEENKEMPVLKQLDFVKRYMVSNSGHAMSSQNPDEFYEKLAGFIYAVD